MPRAVSAKDMDIKRGVCTWRVTAVRAYYEGIGVRMSLNSMIPPTFHLALQLG